MTMENNLQFSQILLLLMLPVTMTQETFVQNIFRKLQSEQNITGLIGAEHKAISHLECAVRCLSKRECKAYQYMGTKEATCMPIYKNCGGRDGQVFQQNVTSHIYEIDFASKVIWNKPPAWSGPEVAFYQGFDTSDGLVSWEGTNQTCNVPLVSGKVNKALTLNHTMKQWVDLGIHTEACMTRPETCGAAGGAISVWVKVIEFSSIGGIMSSYSTESSGTSIRLSSAYFRTSVVVQDGSFDEAHPKSTGWTHIVLNYIGPDNGQGITMYINGTEEDSDTTKDGWSPTAGDGRIVVGRWFTDLDHAKDYASVMIDELIIFNRHLTSAEISALATAT